MGTYKWLNKWLTNWLCSWLFNIRSSLSFVCTKLHTSVSMPLRSLGITMQDAARQLGGISENQRQEVKSIPFFFRNRQLVPDWDLRLWSSWSTFCVALPFVVNRAAWHPGIEIAANFAWASCVPSLHAMHVCKWSDDAYCIRLVQAGVFVCCLAMFDSQVSVRPSRWRGQLCTFCLSALPRQFLVCLCLMHQFFQFYYWYCRVRP